MISISCGDCKTPGTHDLMVDGGMQTEPCPERVKFLDFLEDIIQRRGPFNRDPAKHADNILTDFSDRAKIFKETVE